MGQQQQQQQQQQQHQEQQHHHHQQQPKLYQTSIDGKDNVAMGESVNQYEKVKNKMGGKVTKSTTSQLKALTLTNCLSPITLGLNGARRSIETADSLSLQSSQLLQHQQQAKPRSQENSNNGNNNIVVEIKSTTPPLNKHKEIILSTNSSPATTRVDDKRNLIERDVELVPSSSHISKYQQQKKFNTEKNWNA